MKRIRELLQSAENDLESFPAPWEIIYPDSCKQLKQIANNSFETCICILLDKEISDLEKRIFIDIFAYNTDFDVYIRLLVSSTELYLNGNLEFTIFEYLFVNPHIKQIMKKQYSNDRIKELVKQCLRSDLPKEERLFFMNFRKGKF